MIAKSEEDFKNLRAAGKILAGVLGDLQALCKEGVTGAELDLAAEHAIRKQGAIPSFLNYQPEGAKTPYPAALCLSINDEVVHGLPTPRKLLRKGDIVSLDLGLSYNGYFVDAARTICIGECEPRMRELLRATEEALQGAIAAAKVGARLGALGAAVVRTSKKYDFAIVEELGGHAVGQAVHERPFIANDAKESDGDVIEEGMVLAIEPMLAEGKGAIITDKDGWTLRMKDRKRAAHFEDTVIVQKDGAEIITR